MQARSEARTWRKPVSGLGKEGISLAPPRKMHPGPITLVTQPKMALENGVTENEMGAIQKGLADWKQLRGSKIVDQLLAKAVHLRANIERQIQLLS